MVRLNTPEKILSVENVTDERVPQQANESSEVVGKDDAETPVPFFQLFRFATRKDCSLLILAIFAALGTGPCLSIAVILFGDLANVFVLNSGGAQNASSQIVCFNDTPR